ncbi:hypothetical protein T484DRAFT_1776234 [Baffinella frigidus]|nr:hypothetical protein T484DRAFT_1776234 [Cryptophyta sp. CCMP2293]
MEAPTDHKALANRLFYTCYMGTVNSSRETRERAKNLASEIGAFHIDSNIDLVVTALMSLFRMEPKFRANGSTDIRENLALQNIQDIPQRFRANGSTDPHENLALQTIQARLRMVFGYMLAQLLPWSRDARGSLLVLGTGNALRGYFTKYDCSAADINPIGSISKEDLKRFMAGAGDRLGAWARDRLGYSEFFGKQVLSAAPTALLKP